MPQMAPMNWLFLFLMFSLTFIMFNIINYFNYFPTYYSSKKMKINKSLNWKW
nr:ATP synthase F0 subunit 8 [Paramixogaster sp.]